jgi:hypothetical protein
VVREVGAAPEESVDAAHKPDEGVMAKTVRAVKVAPVMAVEEVPVVGAGKVALAAREVLAAMEAGRQISPSFIHEPLPV